MNIIKKTLPIFLLVFSCNLLFAWAETGHRVIGEVAAQNIKKRTARKIKKLTNYQSLAMMSTFGDEIKSDDRYKKFYTWHFVNFDLGTKYEDSKINANGDIYQAINFCIATIKDEKSSDDDKIFYLKMLIHFVGDLHQPLHIGHESDQGGNEIKLKWFGQPTNLHRVWDENMIDKYNMSYTELAHNLPYKTCDEIEKIQSGTIADWMYESQNLATKVYASTKADENLSYKYQYDYFPMVKTQLKNAGYRLAKILDDLFS